MRLDPIRIYLLITFCPVRDQHGVPAARGSLTWTDGFMFAFVLWMIVTLVFHHGAEKFPYSVVLAVEALGAIWPADCWSALQRITEGSSDIS